MKIALRFGGALWFAIGLIGITAFLGGVISRAAGYASVYGLWGALIFHAVCMFLGVMCTKYASSYRKEPVRVTHRA